MTKYKTLKSFLCFVIVECLVAFMATGCSFGNDNATQAVENQIDEAISKSIDIEENDIRQQEDQQQEAEAVQMLSLTYPKAWVVGEDWCENGTEVNVFYLAEHPVAYHHEGNSVPMDNANYIYPQVIEHDAMNAVVEYNGEQHEVTPNHLMINLPDFMPDIVYDVVYAYASPSDCVGQEIPGLTNAVVDGYENTREFNDYLQTDGYAVPCAYGTYEKLLEVESILESQGYRLGLWDCYRPYRASVFISDKFKEAYESNSVIQDSLGEWSLNWYAADGPSGHNFGTDVDVTILTIDNGFVDTPSHFDAFDESAHLTDVPMIAEQITFDDYTERVKSMPGCLALHEAFLSAGFLEVASEWWHFGDNDTKQEMISLVGPNGLDFTVNDPEQVLS